MGTEVIVWLGINFYLMIGLILVMVSYLAALDSGKQWTREMWWGFKMLLCVGVVCLWPLFIIWGLIQLGGRHGSGGG